MVSLHCIRSIGFCHLLWQANGKAEPDHKTEEPTSPTTGVKVKAHAGLQQHACDTFRRLCACSFRLKCFAALQTQRQAAKGAAVSKKRAAEDEVEEKAERLSPAASPVKRLKTGTHAYVVCNLFNLTVYYSCDS